MPFVFAADHEIDGNRVHAAPINLDPEWTQIRSLLLNLLP